MKTLTCSLFFWLFIAPQTHAQAYFGDTLYIGPGAIFEMKSAFASNTYTALHGQLRVAGNIQISGAWEQPHGGWLIAAGSGLASIHAPQVRIPRLHIAKNSSKLDLAAPLYISDSLTFSQENSFLRLHEFDLLFGEGGIAEAGAPNRFILTNGAGKIRVADLSGFFFPVGHSEDHFSPVRIVQKGIADTLSVRVLPHLMTGGGTGTPWLKDAVDGSWEILETKPGGSSLELMVQWNAATELPGFDRQFCGLAWYNGTGWQLDSAGLGPSTGGDPFFQVRTGISQTGYFAVAGSSFVTSSKNPEAGKIRLIRVFPNPTDDFLSIQFGTGFTGIGKVWLELADISGRVVVREFFPVNDGITRRYHLLDHSLTGGVYALRIFASEGLLYSGLVILQR